MYIKLLGPQWKKILITTNRNLTTRTVAIQGRSMAELQFNAVNRLGLHTEGSLAKLSTKNVDRKC